MQSNTSTSKSEGDLQQMWEKFLYSSLSTVRSQEEVRGQSSLDVDRLSKLLENPVPHLMRLIQNKTDEETVPNGEGRRRSVSWEVNWEKERGREELTKCDSQMEVQLIEKKEFDDAYEKALEKSLIDQARYKSTRNNKEMTMRRRELSHLQTQRAAKCDDTNDSLSRESTMSNESEVRRERGWVVVILC